MDKKIYQHKQETWDEQQCEKRSKVVHRDGFGTVGGPRGLISRLTSACPSYGATKLYSEGCMRNAKKYDGEHIPLPIIPDTYEFVTVKAWGIVIKKKDDMVRWG